MITSPPHPRLFAVLLGLVLPVLAGPVPVSAQTRPTASNESAVHAASWAILAGPKKTHAMGSLDDESGYLLRLELSPRGGALQSAKLTRFFETVEDKQLHEDDPKRYAELARQDPETYKGHYAILKPTGFGGTEMLSTSLETLKVAMKGYKPVTFHAVEPDGEVNRWVLVDSERGEEQQSATFEWAIYRTDAGADPIKALTVRKTYTVRKGSYSVDLKVAFENHTDQPITLSMKQNGLAGLTREDQRTDMRVAAVARWKDPSIEPQLYDSKALNKAEFGKAIPVGRSTGTDQPVVWLGVANKYFAALEYLRPAEQQAENIVASGHEASYDIVPVQAGPVVDEEDLGRSWLTQVGIQDIALAPSGKDQARREVRFDLFLGPKRRSLFLSNPLYNRLKYIETVTTGGCGWCTFDWLRNGLMWLLTFFADTLFFGNYGLAIFLLVAIVRVLLHPLTKRGMVASSKMQKRMQAMRPQMEKIKEKFKDDRAAQQRETMKLYREHGNPMAGMLGCLPMFLQMPIWIALYSGLNSSVNLRHAGLLPVWITDLAAPDALISWSAELPLIGQSFNLLPILLAAVMILQMRFNPSMAGQSAAVTPEQQQQQKMMQFLMPVMMLFIFYKAPSGLNLYIMTSTTVGVIEQFFIRKHIRETEELEAQNETVVKVSGKGPRNSRPKKPKGPFWTKRG